MASIGEQIRDARKAKGITQDALAEAMNVSRQAVSHWETNRTMPDAETLIRLSKVLEHSFEAASAVQPAAEAPENPPEETAQPALVSPAGETPALAVRSPRGKAPYIIGAAVLAVIVLCVCLFAVLALTGKSTPKERAYKYKSSFDGETYTIERFQQETPNGQGKAYLRINPSLTVSRGENFDYWIFEIKYHEMNGIAFSINRIEQVFFTEDKENTEQIFTASDIRAFGLDPEIPAYGDWSYQGGLPVQDIAIGVGVLLRGTDANGASLAFTAYIPLTDK